jgi:hypothetical protein
MQVWDLVVSMHTELRGKDTSNGRGQWVIAGFKRSADSHEEAVLYLNIGAATTLSSFRSIASEISFGDSK